MAWKDARDIVLQICRALRAAHDKGIVHRDMKPENIFLIQREGQPHFVKILDFGIAKVMGLDPNGPRLTRTGMIFGTPEYMAPEQAEGKDTDHRADIYAVGCIMYHLITGQTPFVAESFMTMLTKHLMEDPVPPSVRRPDLVITPEMDALVLKALEKDRDKRWQSMAELLEAVAVCPGPPSDAVPKAPGGQTVEMGGAHAAAALRVLRAKGQETERISRRAVDSALASSAEMAAEVGIRKGKKILLVVAGVAVGVGVAIWLAMSRGQPPAPPAPTAVTVPLPAPCRRAPADSGPAAGARARACRGAHAGCGGGLATRADAQAQQPPQGQGRRKAGDRGHGDAGRGAGGSRPQARAPTHARRAETVPEVLRRESTEGQEGAELSASSDPAALSYRRRGGRAGSQTTARPLCARPLMPAHRACATSWPTFT